MVGLTNQISDVQYKTYAIPVGGVVVLPAALFAGCYLVNVTLFDAAGFDKDINSSNTLLTDSHVSAGCTKLQWLGVKPSLDGSGFSFIGTRFTGINLNTFIITGDTTLTLDLSLPFLPVEMYVFYVKVV